MQDSSPTAQAKASATYNMIVEGVLAETGSQDDSIIFVDFEAAEQAFGRVLSLGADDKIAQRS